MKELFVVKNRSGEIVKGGFNQKEGAKRSRDRFQAETKEGIPDERSNHHNWSFFVAPGKDHHRMEPRRDL